MPTVRSQREEIRSSNSISKFRPRFDQERRHGGGDDERYRDPGEDEGVALGLIVNRAGDEGSQDGAPGVEEIHVAADRAEGFAAEEVSHRSPKNRDRGVEHAVESGEEPQGPKRVAPQHRQDCDDT
jgi:hypothetical protein